jgi:predicted ATP-grasp superfamily ATP-dependent carboligase
VTGRLLLAGVSTRAAAESAARAGFRVTALDAFGDLDQHSSVCALSLPRDFGARFTPAAAARAAKAIACESVAYLSSFENHPTAIATLAAGRMLLGNMPSVVRQVRDPRLVARALRRHHIAVPAVRFDAARQGDWIVKPLASGGGRRVRRWSRGTRVPGGCYLQRFVDGTPGSVVFVAASGRAVPLAVSRQIVGDAAFGAAGFQYCGNILAAARDAQFGDGEALVCHASDLARAIAGAFALIGVNGVDFVARGGVAYAVEVNPRWSASMELVERAHGLSVFGAHASACLDGTLPAFDLARAQRRIDAAGKAIVFARRDVVVGDTRSWIAAGIRDVPHPAERIEAGRPVCTVFASGRDAAACYAGLVRRASRVYAELARWERHVA